VNLTAFLVRREFALAVSRRDRLPSRADSPDGDLHLFFHWCLSQLLHHVDDAAERVISHRSTKNHMIAAAASAFVRLARRRFEPAAQSTVTVPV